MQRSQGKARERLDCGTKWLVGVALGGEMKPRRREFLLALEDPPTQSDRCCLILTLNQAATPLSSRPPSPHFGSIQLRHSIPTPLQRLEETPIVLDTVARSEIDPRFILSHIHPHQSHEEWIDIERPSASHCPHIANVGCACRPFTSHG